MQCNVGTTDRIIRAIAGAAALAWGITNGNVIADIIGVVLLGTAILKFCPAYLPFKLNSCGK
jgi:hypothetical protein